MNEKLKKVLSGVGLLAAFGLGGAAIAGAQSSPSRSSQAPPGAGAQGEGEEQNETGEQNGAGEQNEAGETEQEVTGADAERAGQAALRSVGGGKVLSVQKETPEREADKPEPGEKPDSAEEQAIDRKTAYDVEVEKSDGTIVEVALDDGFNVLSSEKDDEEEGSSDR